MRTFKFTRVYVVSAESKQQATEKLAQTPGEYLDYESVREVVPETKGWIDAFKKQIG